MELAIEECLKTDLQVAASMCIGPEGDMHNVSAAECAAIRMAKAGDHIAGINCHFNPLLFHRMHQEDEGRYGRGGHQQQIRVFREQVPPANTTTTPCR
jgi:hypothetical protein